jgi:hypothetical protein
MLLASFLAYHVVVAFQGSYVPDSDLPLHLTDAVTGGHVRTLEPRCVAFRADLLLRSNGIAPSQGRRDAPGRIRTSDRRRSDAASARLGRPLLVETRSDGVTAKHTWVGEQSWPWGAEPWLKRARSRH